MKPLVILALACALITGINAAPTQIKFLILDGQNTPKWQESPLHAGPSGQPPRQRDATCTIHSNK